MTIRETRKNKNKIKTHHSKINTFMAPRIQNPKCLSFQKIVFIGLTLTRYSWNSTVENVHQIHEYLYITTSTECLYALFTSRNELKILFTIGAQNL